MCDLMCKANEEGPKTFDLETKRRSKHEALVGLFYFILFYFLDRAVIQLPDLVFLWVYQAKQKMGINYATVCVAAKKKKILNKSFIPS